MSIASQHPTTAHALALGQQLRKHTARWLQGLARSGHAGGNGLLGLGDDGLHRCAGRRIFGAEQLQPPLLHTPIREGNGHPGLLIQQLQLRSNKSLPVLPVVGSGSG